MYSKWANIVLTSSDYMLENGPPDQSKTLENWGFQSKATLSENIIIIIK